ncbi:DNA/RNA polymerase [Ceraceosorus guamensis]|uniref:DNA/RNA polymerase n=1 Tax=Ceraceosorus guamensis TaxID=1522189 RepID=A0A316VRL4_9BASI|nr:DNA/RNA polymerase [Ceraceosorus guamensis]PWN40237.1 DNA/RNA polymerase [Ceraceosorus guamensis]
MQAPPTAVEEQDPVSASAPGCAPHTYAPSATLARATYRHLLSSSSLVPSNPLRVIAHCDVDAAYAAFEGRRLGLDPHAVPLAVQQWTGLIAVSYAARRAGVTRFMNIEEAKQKCPDLRLVHVSTYAPGSPVAGYNADPDPSTHKVSLDPYRQESLKLLQIFKQGLPLGAVEKASIDESYFDLTIEVRRAILQAHPHLSNPPLTSDHPNPLDAPLPLPVPNILAWGGERGEVVPAKPVSGPVGDDMSIQAVSTTSEERQCSWTDVALWFGAGIMSDVRARVRETLGYTTSAGIASNKTLAKLCSSMHKPNMQTTMLPAAVPGFLQDLPFQKIRFLGGQLGSAMAEEWGNSTVGGLWHIGKDEMRARFGEESDWVWNVLRGIDHAPIVDRISTKSMLAAKAVRPPIRKMEEAYHWLEILSTELGVRLNTARQESEGLWPKTLTVRWLVAGGRPQSRQARFPYSKDFAGAPTLGGARGLASASEAVIPDSEKEKATNDRMSQVQYSAGSAYIFGRAKDLWREAMGERLARAGSATGVQADNSKPIINISLQFSGLEKLESGQRGIEAFLGADTSTSANSNSNSNSSGRATEGSPGSRKFGNGASGQAYTSRPDSAEQARQSGNHKGIAKLFGQLASPAENQQAALSSSSVAPSSSSRGALKLEEDLLLDDLDLPDEGSSAPVQARREWKCEECGQMLSWTDELRLVQSRPGDDPSGSARALLARQDGAQDAEADFLASDEEGEREGLQSLGQSNPSNKTGNQSACLTTPDMEEEIMQSFHNRIQDHSDFHYATKLAEQFGDARSGNAKNAQPSDAQDQRKKKTKRRKLESFFAKGK